MSLKGSRSHMCYRQWDKRAFQICPAELYSHAIQYGYAWVHRMLTQQLFAKQCTEWVLDVLIHMKPCLSLSQICRSRYLDLPLEQVPVLAGRWRLLTSYLSCGHIHL